ncbi:hypothetical protein DBN05_000623 [Salmonella enterica subsp. enterica serovar Anderlecht]|nr:hypothetical protein [Salmonella enterica subsp. enterica serovar Anderlecht]EEJ3528520.1 hypothetical protein [Salmonella enterica subsp. enterica serovar Anderlecht]MIX06631.1 hypothetical protein [Salmonella enterica subsp. enterica serovar Anderlecht]
MPAYAIYDAIEQRKEDVSVLRTMREEEEAELSGWFAQSIKPRFIQDAVLTALSGKADKAAINNAFDICRIEEVTAKYIQTLSDEISRQQQQINDSFKG